MEKVSSELVQNRRVWSAPIRGVASCIGDASSTRPGRMPPNVPEKVRSVLNFLYPLAEGELAQIKPRSFVLYSPPRHVGHLEEVTVLNALQEAVANFIDHYHISRIYPTRQ